MKLRPKHFPIAIVGLILTVGLAAGVALAQREQTISEQTAQKRQQATTLLDTIPAPSDASKIEYQTIALEGKQQFSGQWTTSASLLNVANYYSKILPENDWDITSNPITNQNQTTGLISATKENRTAYISLNRDSQTNSTTILVTIPSTNKALPLSVEQAQKQYEQTDANSPRTKLAFVANTGIGSNFTHILELIKSEEADYVVHTGDLDLQSNPALFSKTISETLGEDFPYLYVVGDQDLASELWPTEYSQDLLTRTKAADLELTFPEGQNQDSNFDTYAINLGSTHIVALGLGDLDISSTGVGATKYAPFITKTFNESDASLKICVFHETMFQIQTGNQIDSMSWKPFEACREQGAMIVTGADHSYQRSKTILSYPEQTTSQIWNQKDMVRLEPGTSFIVNSGLGGSNFSLQERCKPITPPYGCQGEWASIYSLNQEAQPGVLFLEIAEAQQTLASGYFKNIHNQLIDSFSMSLWKQGAQLTEATTTSDSRILSATDDRCSIQISKSRATQLSSTLVCN